MTQRKSWTSEEDRILKFLIQERGLSKWSQISRVMENQFKIQGRNGKQCRERYHNHLAKNITTSEWTIEQQNILFQLQDQIGNKWALISSRLPGRTDNYVKNHFYSKLRKSVRKINKKIHKFMKKQFRDIKTNTLYRIIQTMESRNKLTQNVENNTYQLCRKIKNQLRRYEDLSSTYTDSNEEISFVRNIIEDIAEFDKDIKKSPRKISNLKSSAKFSEGSIAKVSSNKVSSTKSVYDDQSESCSNSNSDIVSVFSSSSFGHGSIHSYHSQSQRLLRPLKIFRSQNIQSESEDDSSEDEGKILYMSSNDVYKLKHKRTMPEIKQQSIKHENSIKSSNSNSQNENQMCIQPYNSDMLAQESFEMRVISPKQLTIEEKIEMNNINNDMLFYGEAMIIEDDALIKGFEGLNLMPPKLGLSDFE